MNAVALTVNFFGGLREVTKGEKNVQVTATSVKTLLDHLASMYGNAFKERVLDPTGAPKRFINILVNNKDIRFLKNLETELKEGDEVILLPAVGGG